jgi:hypothetical protein
MMAKVVIRVFGFRQARISKAMPAACMKMVRAASRNAMRKMKSISLWEVYGLAVRGGSLIPAPPQTHHAEFGYRTVISRSSMLLTNL